MTGNIINLPKASNDEEPDIVSVLEELLAMAKDKKIKAIAYGGIASSGKTFFSWNVGDVPTDRVVASVSALNFALNQAWLCQ